MRVSNNYVHVPVVPKVWLKIWMPPGQRRHRAASSPYCVACVASSRLQLQLWSPLSVQSSPDRAIASGPPFAEVAPLHPILHVTWAGAIPVQVGLLPLRSRELPLPSCLCAALLQLASFLEYSYQFSLHWHHPLGIKIAQKPYIVWSLGPKA